MSAAVETAKAGVFSRPAPLRPTGHPRIRSAQGLALGLSGQESNAMQSLVQLDSLEVPERSAARRSSRSRSLFQALRRTLRRIARLDLFSLEDEMGRAIDRAFAEFAREMRK